MADSPNIVSKHPSGWAKPIDKKDVERAMRNSRSNKSAARYLGVSLPTYKKYASLYKNDEGENLYEAHNNKSGKGVPKYSSSLDKKSVLLRIMSGEMPKTFYSTTMFKENLIKEGLIEEKCCRCDFHERRVMDFRVPVILNFKDGNKNRWMLDNLELLCYNCYYLCIGDLFEKKQLDSLEDITKPAMPVPKEFELPKQHEDAIIRSKNLDNEERPDDFGDDLIVNFRKH